MSNDITNQVKLLKTGSPTAKAVLMALADCADDSGYCYPSIDRLVLITEFTDRTIEKAIFILESCGLIRVNRAIGRHNSYQFTVENYQEPAKEIRSLKNETSEFKNTTSESNDKEPANLKTQPANLLPKPAKEIRSKHININKHHKETSSKQDAPKKQEQFDFKTELKNLGCDPQHIDDWMEVRKKKKGINSKTAFKDFMDEVEKAHITHAQAVEWCAKKSWAGFNAGWYANANGSNQQACQNLQQTNGKKQNEWDRFFSQFNAHETHEIIDVTNSNIVLQGVGHVHS